MDYPQVLAVYRCTLISKIFANEAGINCAKITAKQSLRVWRLLEFDSTQIAGRNMFLATQDRALCASKKPCLGEIHFLLFHSVIPFL